MSDVLKDIVLKHICDDPNIPDDMKQYLKEEQLSKGNDMIHEENNGVCLCEQRKDGQSMFRVFNLYSGHIFIETKDKQEADKIYALYAF